MADHQHLAVDICQTQVHFAVFVLKNPKAQGLFCQIAALLFGVVGAYAQQDEKAFADFADGLAGNGNRGGIYSCQNSTHVILLKCIIQNYKLQMEGMLKGIRLLSFVYEFIICN